MAGYKLQGKTKDGNIVDIPLTATYDAAGNDIANQFEQINEKLAENENSIAVTVIQPNEWISLPDKIGVETYIFPQGINSNNAEGMNYLEPIPHTLRGKSFVLKINTVNSSDRIWEFTSSRNDCGKEVYVWGENDELGYKSLVDGKPNWQRVLMVDALVDNDLSSFTTKSNSSFFYQVKRTDTYEDFGIHLIDPNTGSFYRQFTLLFPSHYDMTRFQWKNNPNLGYEFYNIPEDYDGNNVFGCTWTITLNSTVTDGETTHSGMSTFTDHKGQRWIGYFGSCDRLPSDDPINTTRGFVWSKVATMKDFEDLEISREKQTITVLEIDEEITTTSSEKDWSWNDYDKSYYINLYDNVLDGRIYKLIFVKIAVIYTPENANTPCIFRTGGAVVFDGSGYGTTFDMSLTDGDTSGDIPNISAYFTYSGRNSILKFIDIYGNIIEPDLAVMLINPVYERTVTIPGTVSNVAGTSVTIDGIKQKSLDFIKNPQTQILENADKIAQLSDIAEGIKPIIMGQYEWISELPTEVGERTYIFPKGCYKAEAENWLPSTQGDIHHNSFILKITTYDSSNRTWEFTSGNGEYSNVKYIWTQSDSTETDSYLDAKPNWQAVTSQSTLNGFRICNKVVDPNDVLEIRDPCICNLAVDPTKFPNNDIPEYVASEVPQELDKTHPLLITCYYICEGSGKTYELRDLADGSIWLGIEKILESNESQIVWQKVYPLENHTKTQIKTRRYELTRSGSSSAADAWFYCDDVDITNAISCEIEFTNADKNRGFKGTAGVPNFDGSSISTFDSVLGNFSGVEIGNNNNFTFFSTVGTCTTTLDGATHKALNVRLVKSHCKTLTNNDAEFKDYTGIENARCVLTIYYQE